jgi:hypothetical protein
MGGYSMRAWPDGLSLLEQPALVTRMFDMILVEKIRADKLARPTWQT